MNDIDKLKHDSLQLYLDAERRYSEAEPASEEEAKFSPQMAFAYDRFKHDLCFDTVGDLIEVARFTGYLMELRKVK